MDDDTTTWEGHVGGLVPLFSSQVTEEPLVTKMSTKPSAFTSPKLAEVGEDPAITRRVKLGGLALLLLAYQARLFPSPEIMSTS